MSQEYITADAIAPRPEEFDRANAWWNEHMFGDAALPWAFTYAGMPVTGGVPADWSRERSTRQLDEQREELTFRAVDPLYGLELSCTAVRYRDYPAVEWTVILHNRGAGVTPIISDLDGIDTVLHSAPPGDFTVRSISSDGYNADSYAPWEHRLCQNDDLEIAPTGGRGSKHAFPYFAIEDASGGALMAVGWPGQWRACFTRDHGDGLCVRAGQQRTHLRLQPGESVRTPLITLLFHTGVDRVRTQNLWRRWMIAHNLPRLAGALPSPMLLGSANGLFVEMTRATTANQCDFASRYQQAGCELTHWWMDAGWYPCRDCPNPLSWPQTGTWEVDTSRFPRGLREISDHARALGMQSLLWFEPERVAPNTWLHNTHPAWLLLESDRLGLPPGPYEGEQTVWNASRLLDLGNSDARNWLIAHITTLLDHEGINIYRQDFNISPLPFWRDNDSPSREGLCENRYTCGYLAYWDALRAHHPDGLLIDSCSGGGCRNDLETMRRGVALHTSDYNHADLPTHQAFHHSLFQWLPFIGEHATAVSDAVDVYAFRSALALSTTLNFDMRRNDLDLDLLRRLCEEWRAVSPCFYGDFYPLTPYSRSEEVWMAWQFHRPAENDGVIQAFRREQCPYPEAEFQLSGLDPTANYQVVNFDDQVPKRFRGAELLANLRIALPNCRSATTIHYQLI